MQVHLNRDFAALAIILAAVIAVQLAFLKPKTSRGLNLYCMMYTQEQLEALATFYKHQLLRRYHSIFGFQDLMIRSMEVFYLCVTQMDP